MPSDLTVPVEATRVDPKLLEILVCPLTKGSLEYDFARQELISRSAKLAYPIRDGIPIMLPEEARPLLDGGSWLLRSPDRHPAGRGRCPPRTIGPGPCTIAPRCPFRRRAEFRQEEASRSTVVSVVLRTDRVDPRRPVVAAPKNSWCPGCDSAIVPQHHSFIRRSSRMSYGASCVPDAMSAAARRLTLEAPTT